MAKCCIGLSVGLIFLGTMLKPYVALAQVSSASAVRGIYAVNAIVGGNSLDTRITSNPSVDGVLIRLSWSNVEPLEGTFNWKWSDRLIALAAAAGKKVTIGVGAGYQTPSWVYADGAQSFPFIWDQGSWGPPICSVATIPIPWDPVFQEKWAALITAFATHYASNSAVASVKLTGVNSETQETALPKSNHRLLKSGSTSCYSYNDPANWQAAGYTRVKVENAWERIELNFFAAFPKTPLEAMEVAGFPPIDDLGNLIPGQWQDTQLPADIANIGVTDLGAQFVLQNNGLSATSIWPLEATYTSEIATGYQMVGALDSGLLSAINLAIAAKAKYLEIYTSDIIRQPDAIRYAHKNL